MDRYIDQFDVVDILAKKTGYYKYQIREVIDALEETIYENMQTATYDEPSECRLFFGFVLGAKRVPAKKKRHPYSQEMVDIVEHLNPYVTFKKTFRKKINEFEEGNDNLAEELTDEAAE
jgi:nucleoid DNA-binding protein